MFYPLDPLDIFKINLDGSVLWCGAAKDFVAAKRFIEKLALSVSGEYLILNQQTGQRQRMRVVSPNDSARDSLNGGTHYLEIA
jgi:hypothetical protein